ncbi:hypothetical protein V5J73_06985 [Flavobacterium sp. KS-LB2]|uniref:hypothetical protein n=1 Tax=Flavobacterium sp. KS-LB2 TaxID=3120525 RepID=UPI0030CACB97
MVYKFPIKFTEIHIDEFINYIYQSIDKKEKEFVFDLSQVQWISNQNLLLFTAVLKYLYASNLSFKVKFLEPGVPTGEVNDRVKIQIVQLWEIWKIYSVISDGNFGPYFDIDYGSVKIFISELKSKGKYNESDKEIYDRFGITPFVSLDRIENYKDEKLLDNEIEPIYALNELVREKLIRANCDHPFVNKTLSSIITKELYENFLDHTNFAFLQNERNWAFMSLALKQGNSRHSQSILEKNFYEEELAESVTFFKHNGAFKSEPLLQFSFVDFGEGIAMTLLNQYRIDKKISANTPVDDIEHNNVLKHAFEYNSSRLPIKEIDDTFFIPRGLFDLLTIVRRYRGLLILRSNEGKIMYDFSNTSNLQSAFKTFGDNSKYFPGTFITIYLPALLNIDLFNNSVIKPEYNFQNNKIDDTRHINLYTIFQNLNSQKEFIYTELIENLRTRLENKTSKCFLNYISFLGCRDERLIKKSIFYFLTSYEVNNYNNIVVFHPPEKHILQSINEELCNLSELIKNFKIHPIPFIYSSNSEELDVLWLGLYNEDDKKNLNKYVYEGHLSPKSDFKDFNNILGHLQFYDDHNNVYSHLPHINFIDSYYKKFRDIDDVLVEELLEMNKCLRNEGLYLCNGNYYQNTFLQLTDLLNNDEDCFQLTKMLHERIIMSNEDEYAINYIAVTAASHKIVKSMIKERLIIEENCIFLDNYFSFERDKKIANLKAGVKYVLVGDAISTGGMTKRLNKLVTKAGSELVNIAVIANTLDKEFENSKDFINEYGSKILALYTYPIKKYLRTEISDKQGLKEVIRINPYTNIPITFSDNNTLKETIIYDTEEFSQYLEDDDITINFKVFNNLIHPYFFNLKNILKRENANLKGKLPSLFTKIFDAASLTRVNDLKIFFPKNSDISFLDFELLKSKIFQNHSIEFFELERFNTEEGWKFPHTTDFYSSIVEDSKILILDDGSCSGDSLLQMINELSFFNPSKIDLLCLIGRVDDHKREFFSRINMLSTRTGNEVKVNIYFGSHWHISTFYLNNSPYSKEIDWLTELLKIQNTPLSLRNIAQVILRDISPQKDSVDDYKYLAKNKVTGFLPKKDIILVRNEIGKIAGYRFYKESFNWFNSFITKYEGKDKSEDRTKEIELLCMCLLYEPYLYDRIANLLPDIKEKLQEFVDTLIIGHPVNGLKIDLDKHLYYNWNDNKRDILHLFFIVYKNENLINKISEENLLKLLEFASGAFIKSNGFNYILYKLLVYFPLNKSEVFLKPHAFDLSLFIMKMLDSDKLDLKSKSDLSRFCSFINTLPTGNDFKSQLNEIRNLYWEQDQPRLHDDRNSINHNISMIIVTLREMKNSSEKKEVLPENKIVIIKDRWGTIKFNFLDKIITFYRSFDDFFKPYPYFLILDKMEKKSNSLLQMYVSIDEFVFNISQRGNDPKNYDIACEFLEAIQIGFGIESEFRKIFDTPTVDSASFTSKFIDKLKQLETKIEVENKLGDESYIINIPEVYVDKLIVEEIYNNLKYYSNKAVPVKICIHKDNEHLFFEIENYYIESVKEFSSKEGLNSLNYLSDGSIFDFLYSHQVNTNDKIFNQILKFKI